MPRLAHNYFYAVDRNGALREGQTLRLHQPRNKAARAWFPQGLSSHGRGFVLGEDSDAQGVRIEILLELLRRERFPNKPSRLQSFFAFSSLDAARQFRRQKRHDQAPIFRLQARAGHRGDMRLLRWSDDFLQNLSWGVKYWRGQASPRPQWEILLVPPVRVVERSDS